MNGNDSPNYLLGAQFEYVKYPVLNHSAQTFDRESTFILLIIKVRQHFENQDSYRLGDLLDILLFYQLLDEQSSSVFTHKIGQSNLEKSFVQMRSKGIEIFGEILQGS